MADHLSPAASAIVAAFSDRHELCGPFDGNWPELCLAAALRAAADQVVPEEESCEGGFSDSLEHQCRASERRLARAELLGIAAELEAT